MGDETRDAELDMLRAEVADLRARTESMERALGSVAEVLRNVTGLTNDTAAAVAQVLGLAEDWAAARRATAADQGDAPPTDDA